MFFYKFFIKSLDKVTLGGIIGGQVSFSFVFSKKGGLRGKNLVDVGLFSVRRRFYGKF